MSRGAAPATALAPWVVVLAGVSAAVHVGKLPPAVPVLQADFGITLVQAGFLLSLVQLGAMLLGLVAGLTADSLGLRRCMLAGLALLSAASLAGMWVQDASGLMGLRALEGLGVLLSIVPAPSLLRRIVPPARQMRMLGVWGGFMPFGTALALLLGPAIMQLLGWRGWWLLAAAGSICMLLWVWRAVPPDAVADVSPQAPAGPRWWQRLGQTLSAPGPWLGALCFAAYSAQWLAVIGFLPTLYLQLGWGGALGAVLTASVAAVNVIGNVLAGRLLQRGWPARRLLWLGFAAMALGSWLAFSASTAGWPWLRYAGALLFSTLGGLIPGGLFALAPRLAPNERSIATTVGWIQQWSATGQMAGPPVVAWVASRLGHWDGTWLVTVACCLAGMGLAVLVQHHTTPSFKPAAGPSARA